jgi:plasmid stabilization system protein ParE
MVANFGPWRIIYQPRALADIRSIRKFIAERSPEEADRYARFLLAAVENIANLPTAFQVYYQLPIRSGRCDSSR